jgi:hypothetical protein
MESIGETIIAASGYHSRHDMGVLGGVVQPPDPLRDVRGNLACISALQTRLASRSRIVGWQHNYRGGDWILTSVLRSAKQIGMRGVLYTYSTCTEIAELGSVVVVSPAVPAKTKPRSYSLEIRCMTWEHPATSTSHARRGR